MIDWLFVLRHALWILGASIVLAAWSFGRVEGFHSFCRIAMQTGAFLFCIGIVLTL